VLYSNGYLRNLVKANLNWLVLHLTIFGVGRLSFAIGRFMQKDDVHLSWSFVCILITEILMFNFDKFSFS